jgi:hypothetical protein
MVQQCIQACLINHTGREVQMREVAAALQQVLQQMCIKECMLVSEQQPGRL